jgi:nicotinamide-nucleotide amidase
MLDVDPKLIATHGAVSEPVGRALAQAARVHVKSTYGLATTGIAGPTGGSADKPVGTVYVALAAPEEIVVKQLFFPSDRETFKQLSAQAAFDLLRRKLV